MYIVQHALCCLHCSSTQRFQRHKMTEIQYDKPAIKMIHLFLTKLNSRSKEHFRSAMLANMGCHQPFLSSMKDIVFCRSSVSLIYYSFFIITATCLLVWSVITLPFMFASLSLCPVSVCLLVCFIISWHSCFFVSSLYNNHLPVCSLRHYCFAIYLLATFIVICLFYNP